MESKSFTVDTIQKLEQLLEWAYRATSVQTFSQIVINEKESHLDDSDEEIDEGGRPDVSYTFKIDESFNLSKDMDDSENLVLPKLSFDDVIVMARPLILNNYHGINYDKRGVKDEFLEFRDFYDLWELEARSIKVADFLTICYKLKSHKFENWYEWVQGAVCFIENGRFIAKLKVDQGS